jgi:DNA polymerase-1
VSSKKVSHSLKEVARRELGEELDKGQQKADWGGELTDEMLAYAANDAEILLSLQEKLAAKVEAAGLKRVMEIEDGALPAMVWMANAGASFDAEGWRGHLEQVEQDKNRQALELETLSSNHTDGGQG